MRIFTFCLASDPNSPQALSGWVRARDREAALAFVNDPDANLYDVPSDVEWPGAPDSAICWERSGNARGSREGEEA
jgi:hypothetical protein